MTQSLDLKGLKCPLPVLRAKKTLKSMAPGETLEVLATDPGAVKDFPAFCQTTGNTLESWSETDGVFRFVLRKKA
ncbi:MAG: sulfurtransferase TusA family protein [Alphaproteobacteria bacterium]|jgi:tRNA 2-thiouridine synthesizing protein A